ncbi:MAG: polyprenyl synthetase family protein [Alphaproteobacteria bacterium]|nr:polyprenyl synthetase family protein [Alphaproteobacteria bacterium]
MFHAPCRRIQNRDVAVSAIVNLNEKREEIKPPSLDRLVGLTAADLAQVNAVILEQMQSPVLLIPQLAGHIIAAGGKRLRPMLTLSAARLCGYGGTRHVGLAACVEFIHTATLLHDDVVDESDLRRGAATANAVWGNKSSVLVGDFLFARAFELMVADGSLEVLRILSRASSVIAEGEVHQLVTANDTETLEEDYLEVIRAKTAKLFAAACEIGAVVNDRREAERLALESFGHNLGMAFQLIDDVLDYSARQATLGKTVGDDFREGKITLPIVLAFRAADEEARAFWRRTLEDLEQKKGDFRRAVNLLEQTGALRATVDRARDYAVRAAEALRPFPDGEHKQALLESVDFAVARGF